MKEEAANYMKDFMTPGGFVVSNTVLASDKQVILALLAGDGHGVGSTHFGQDDPQRFPRAEL